MQGTCHNADEPVQVLRDFALLRAHHPRDAGRFALGVAAGEREARAAAGGDAIPTLFTWSRHSVYLSSDFP
jgi:hypothetical protein